ncbi:hypothetical protein GKZ68_00125 [Hymenobacter sp. BRD128]|uniref:hypothetical protein n=1 Tax=Hymenobacter sp. BRD128 TaxID=2675878 RepID=UPI0015654CC6|nr:hypothetical protein [Hymenobacter sp. BRD128]QKG55183.1 hypothetical protein GKZ68_00125 [Hymenobacter sp. BRD128]
MTARHRPLGTRRRASTHEAELRRAPGAAAQLDGRPEGAPPHDLHEKPFTKSQFLQEELIKFERGVLQELQQKERTSDDLLRKLENELDLEEARLELDKGLF